jgi:hypothetical protein
MCKYFQNRAKIAYLNSYDLLRASKKREIISAYFYIYTYLNSYECFRTFLVLWLKCCLLKN